ncbi:MAG TPA: SCP2 sterol-binding domain-containing protein [Anaerolineaceae bacterium]|nr:SCP2 sterol-binding domain-containing protein [Anaerolineaceae bacterium]
MSERSVQDWLDEVPAHFIPENSTGMDVVIQLDLTGEQGGDWYITIQNQQVHVTKGVASNPKLTVKADAQDILKILTGKMDGMRAFMQGKLKVSGEMGLALKLIKMFRA